MKRPDLDSVLAHAKFGAELAELGIAGRGEEALERALRALQDEPSAASASLTVSMADGLGDEATALMAVAVGIAFDSSAPQLRRRLAIEVARRGLRGLAQQILVGAWEAHARDLRRMGAKIAPGLRDSYLGILDKYAPDSEADR